MTDPYQISQAAYETRLIGDLIAMTRIGGETAAEQHIRASVIVAMFKDLEPGSPMEVSIACHCIALRFLADAALRDASDPAHDAAMQTKLRAQAMAISRTWQSSYARFEKTKARHEARAAEADAAAEARPPAAATDTPPTPEPAASDEAASAPAPAVVSPKLTTPGAAAAPQSPRAAPVREVPAAASG